MIQWFNDSSMLCPYTCITHGTHASHCSSLQSHVHTQFSIRNSLLLQFSGVLHMHKHLLDMSREGFGGGDITGGGGDGDVAGD